MGPIKHKTRFTTLYYSDVILLICPIVVHHYFTKIKKFQFNFQSHVDNVSSFNKVYRLG